MEIVTLKSFVSAGLQQLRQAVAYPTFNFASNQVIGFATGRLLKLTINRSEIALSPLHIN